MAAEAASILCALLGVVVVLVVGTIWRKRALQKHAEEAAQGGLSKRPRARPNSPGSQISRWMTPSFVVPKAVTELPI